MQPIVQRMCRLVCLIFLGVSSLYAEERQQPNSFIDQAIPLGYREDNQNPARQPSETLASNRPIYWGNTRGFYSNGAELAWIDSLPLEDRIRISLRQNPTTAPYADKIMITNYEGMVVLEGTVRFYSERSQIQAVVQQTNGVYRVDNEITTSPIRNRRAPPSQVLPRPDSY